jgi:PAS domain-containing protein
MAVRPASGHGQAGNRFISQAPLFSPDTYLDLDQPFHCLAGSALRPALPLSEVAFAVAEGSRPTSDQILFLAAAIPLVANQRNIGAVLIAGNPISDHEMTRWQALTDDFAHALAPYCAHIEYRETEVAVLRVVAAALRTDVDFTETQHHVIKEACRLFRAETAQLVQFDPDNCKLIIKSNSTRARLVQPVQHALEPGLISQAIEDSRIIALTDVEAPQLQSAHRRHLRQKSANTDDRAAVHAPRKFRRADPVQPRSIRALRLSSGIALHLAAALANAIHNAQRLMQFKIINADLEASRLELLHSRNTLRALFDNLPVSIYIVDHSYKIYAINQSRSDRAEEKPHILVGKNVSRRCTTATPPAPAAWYSRPSKPAESTHASPENGSLKNNTSSGKSARIHLG